MFEADSQKFHNQYLDGAITHKKLDAIVQLWPNFKTDYKPLKDFAKENKLRFVTTNIPRWFASLVFKKDLAALGLLKEEEKFCMAPLPILFDINLSGYKTMIGM